MVRDITLTVPDDFVLGSWATDPETTARILGIASLIPDFVRSECDEDGMRRLVSDAVEATTKRDDRTHINDLETKLSNTEQQVAELKLRVATSAHHMEMEEARMRSREEHAVQTQHLTVENMVREGRAELHSQLQTLTVDHAQLQHAHQQLAQTLHEQVAHARRDAIAGGVEKNNLQLAEISETNRVLQQEKVATEKTLCNQMRESCQQLEQHAGVVTELRTRISELETPMGRGRAGELNVAETLRDAGFVVEDTSMGEKRDMGHLDLLVRHESVGTDSGDDVTTSGNMRIAIELKNVKVVQKQERDDFERKVRAGIASNLFDAAIFISIRAHTKKGAPVVLDMFMDEGKRPLVPVTWFGPERAKNATPLTPEQVETHVMMVSALLSQCHNIRRELCNGTRDVHMQSLQNMFDSMGVQLNGTFTDLSKQSKLIDDMRSTLTSIRVRAISMCTTIWHVNRDIPWLGRDVNMPWMDVYEGARVKTEEGMKDADIWNQCSRNKSSIERTIGKDAMFQSLRNEKRVRGEDGDQA